MIRAGFREKCKIAQSPNISCFSTEMLQNDTGHGTMKAYISTLGYTSHGGS